MGLLDKAGNVKAAPTIKFFPDALFLRTVAEQQAIHEGTPDHWREYADILVHATDAAALPFETRPMFTNEAFRRFRGKLIRRDDYAAWLQRIGEPPPFWWVCEGDTANQAEQSQPKRAPGRPKDPAALKNRMGELREDAIKAARVIGGNPQVQQVANHLTKHGWSDYTFDTIKSSLRKPWWQPLKVSKK